MYAKLAPKKNKKNKKTAQTRWCKKKIAEGNRNGILPGRVWHSLSLPVRFRLSSMRFAFTPQHTQLHPAHFTLLRRQMLCNFSANPIIVTAQLDAPMESDAVIAAA